MLTIYKKNKIKSKYNDKQINPNYTDTGQLT